MVVNVVRQVYCCTEKDKNPYLAFDLDKDSSHPSLGQGDRCYSIVIISYHHVIGKFSNFTITLRCKPVFISFSSYIEYEDSIKHYDTTYTLTYRGTSLNFHIQNNAS